MNDTCNHEHLTRHINDAEYRFMTSYKEGFRPYVCPDCGGIFWVKPLAITVTSEKEMVR